MSQGVQAELHTCLGNEVKDLWHNKKQEITHEPPGPSNPGKPVRQLAGVTSKFSGLFPPAPWKNFEKKERNQAVKGI